MSTTMKPLMKPLMKPRWAARAFAAAAAMALFSAVAGEAPLQLAGDGAYHRLRVPLNARAQSTDPELSDLRVLNAAGSAVPYAWLDTEPDWTAEPKRQRVPLLKAPASARATAASATADAALPGWLVDLRAVAGVPQELQFDVAPGANGVFGFSIEASDDLQQWRTIESAAQLVALQYEGQRLERSSFELSAATGVRGGYLRLRPLPGQDALPLKGVQVASMAHRRELPDWQWSEAIAPSQCQAEYCDYVLPRHLPLQRLEIQLAESNTLARVEVLAQPEVMATTTAPASSRHHRFPHPVRDHLKTLHRKTAPPAPAADTAGGPSGYWLTVDSGSVYALRVRGNELRSTTLELPGGWYTHVRLKPVGGIAQLGAKPPSIRVAGRAANLVFLARGQGPYRLAWNQTSPSVEMPLAQLMPGTAGGEPADDAALPEATVVAAPPKPATPPPVASAPASAAAAADPKANQKLWLWGAMVVALGLMGFMAWSLLKPGATKAES